jgi:DNA-binding CsgD family transcriptional regulator/signal transduction histidine kinase
MDQDWTRASRVLEATERILIASRSGILTGFSREIADLVPHRAAVMRTPDCPREPVKVSGDPSITELVTSVELAHLAERAAAGEAVVTEGVLAGAVRPLVISESGHAGSLLVLIPTEGTAPGEAALELVSRLWNVLSIDATRRADEVPAAHFPDNLAIAAARSRAIADMEHTHATALSALLAVLRSSRLSDAVARRNAEDLAVNALLELRQSSIRDNELSTDTADDAFAALADQLAPTTRHAEAAVELSGPGDARLLPRDLSQVARDLTHGLVLAALEHQETGRVRVSWRLRDSARTALDSTALDSTALDPTALDSTALHVTALHPTALRVTVRDDGPGTDGAPRVADRTAERVTAVGGRIEVDSVPGWGTTVTAAFPLDMGEPPATGPIDDLHARELEVLTGLAEGMRNREIAQRLRLSEHTVKFHVRNILAKLGVSTRGQAAALALGRHGAKPIRQAPSGEASSTRLDGHAFAGGRTRRSPERFPVPGSSSSRVGSDQDPVGASIGAPALPMRPFAGWRRSGLRKNPKIAFRHSSGVIRLSWSTSSCSKSRWLSW